MTTSSVPVVPGRLLLEHRATRLVGNIGSRSWSYKGRSRRQCRSLLRRTGIGSDGWFIIRSILLFLGGLAGEWQLGCRSFSDPFLCRTRCMVGDIIIFGWYYVLGNSLLGSQCWFLWMDIVIVNMVVGKSSIYMQQRCRKQSRSISSRIGG